jgi:hypothetical protein
VPRPDDPEPDVGEQRRRRAARQPLTSIAPPRSRGRAAEDDKPRRTGPYRRAQSYPTSVCRAAVSISWPSSEEETPMLSNSNPHRSSALRRQRSPCPQSPPRTSTFASARRRLVMSSFHRRVPATPGCRATGTTAPSVISGCTATGSAPPRLCLPTAEVGAGRRSLAPAARLVGPRRPRSRRRSQRLDAHPDNPRRP